MGFEPLVNQRLLPPTFPRYAKIVGRDQAVDYFDALLKRLLSVCDVIHIVGFHFIIVSLNESHLVHFVCGVLCCSACNISKKLTEL